MSKLSKIIVSGCVCAGLISSMGSVASASEKDMLTIKGSVDVVVSGTGGAEIIIEKNTFEGKLKYYDKKIESGNYTFLLDACEYDFSARDYTSSYTITIKSLLDPKSVYTIDNVKIADDGYQKDIKYTSYVYNVDFSKSDTRSVNAEIDEPAVVDGQLRGKGTITFKYRQYNLGDLNDDEKIDSKDAVIILRDYAEYLVNGKYSIDVDAADINNDGKIDSKDAVRILIYYANTLVNSNVPPIEEFFE